MVGVRRDRRDGRLGAHAQRVIVFFQAEDGIRDYKVTGVQTCALPIYTPVFSPSAGSPFAVGTAPSSVAVGDFNNDGSDDIITTNFASNNVSVLLGDGAEIGRASCRERV